MGGGREQGPVGDLLGKRTHAPLHLSQNGDLRLLHININFL